jgi:hypothetical protein
MKRNLLTAVICTLVIQSILGQEFTFPELQGYRKVKNYPVYTPDNLWDFINGAADNYLSYGFEDLNVVEYQKGKNVIKLEIYKHRNNIQAFGIYSSERSSSFRFINLGAQGYKSDGSINFFKGRYYVKIRTSSSSEKVLQSMESLALRTADMLPGENTMPAMLNEFPQNGKKANEETYINESVLGHEYLNSAFRSVYEAENTPFSIYILDKPTADEASLTVLKYLSSSGIDIDDQSGGKYVFRDGYNGDIFLAWKEKRIVIITGLAKDQADIANLYTSQILN